MITSHDRSGWFGASDTSKIMGNWNTETFIKFWLEKTGLMHKRFATPSMLAGTHYEHRILIISASLNATDRLKYGGSGCV